jgi:hypothetical protein
MINILKKLSSKLDKSTNPFIIIISLFFLFLGKIVFKYKKILDRIINGPKIKYRNGNKYFYKNRKLHRDDGPAVEWNDGTKWWYQNGKCHRLDGPAYENIFGDKEWYKNGQLHRLNGPAKDLDNGNKEWYQNGLLHRDNDLPAVDYDDGSKKYYQYGKLHRLNGPAVKIGNKTKHWYIEGKRYSEKRYNEKIQELSKPKTKVYIDKNYTSSLEDWDERFNNNFTKRNTL